MGQDNIRASDRAAVVGVIDPDANTAGTLTTGWVSMADWGRVMAIVFAGDLGASATLDAKLEQATSSGGAGAKDITGKAITQLTQAGTDSNKQAIINCHREELDLANGYTHVRLSHTVATATSDSGAVLLGFDPRYNTAADNDATTVDEIV
jgi:hypothetical protein